MSKNYVVEVTTKFDDGGYGSQLYGWSTSPFFTKREAKAIKKRLKDQYHLVEILKVK